MSVFHDGDLQSGIARAIKEQKLVACFIAEDKNDTSKRWEDSWLGNNAHPTDILSDDTPPLGHILSEKAVFIRIEFGSQEMAFLNAFCPIEAAPSLVVIQNGKVLEKLSGDITQDEFSARLCTACGLGSEDDDSAEMQTKTNGGAVESAPSSSQSDQPSAAVQTLLSERAQRLEAERVKREAAEKADRIARANARRKEIEAAEAGGAQNGKGKQRATTDEKDKQQARDAWIYQQKKRKDEAKLERERILGQIESDKQERKAQAQRRREMEALNGGGASSELANAQPKQSSVSSTALTSCALQVRLFDGSSIRGKFSSDTDIASTVRKWVKETSPEGGADIPYSFRQILAPLPSRTIEVSEEHQTLQDLGLVPSATLVLVPIAGYTDAYSSANQGYVGSALSAVYNTAFGVLGSVISYIPVVNGLYMGGTADEQEPSNVQGAQMAGGDTGTQETRFRVKTLADQRAEKKQAAEFYNGNSSAFQGRPAPEDEDDDDNER